MKGFKRCSVANVITQDDKVWAQEGIVCWRSGIVESEAEIVIEYLDVELKRLI